MRRLLLIFLVIILLPVSGWTANVASGKGTNFISVTFDGSTSFDLCAYLGVNEVTLYAISLDYHATNDTLTVTNGNGGSRIFGPYVDVTGSGLLRNYWPRVVKPYVPGTSATAGSKATFEVEYINR